MLQFSEEAARKLQAAYTTADVIAQRAFTLELLALLPGEIVLDVGCGPGFLCEDMARAVGPTGRVLGIDVSEDLLTFASHRNECAWLRYIKGDGAALPLNDNSFEVVVSTQVMEYLADPDRALAEMFRVLKPGGRALIMATDWDRIAWYSADQNRMARVRKAWEEHCAHPHLPRTLVRQARAAGLQLTQLTDYVITNTRLDASTYSHALVDLMTDFLRRRGTISAVELEGWANELHDLSSRGRYFFSTTRSLCLLRKPTSLRQE